MSKGMQALLWAFVLLEARDGHLVSSSIPCAQLWSQGLVDLGLIRWNASMVLSEEEVGTRVDMLGWTVETV